MTYQEKHPPAVTALLGIIMRPPGARQLVAAVSLMEDIVEHENATGSSMGIDDLLSLQRLRQVDQ